MSAVIIKALWIYGLAIVVSMLIAVVIKIIVVGLRAAERKPAAARAEVRAAKESFDVAAEHVAAISAAVVAMTGAHRIVRIESSQRGTSWAAEGRTAQHLSHAPAHHPKR
jgi:hypothetical protein